MVEAQRYNFISERKLNQTTFKIIKEHPLQTQSNRNQHCTSILLVTKQEMLLSICSFSSAHMLTRNAFDPFDMNLKKSQPSFSKSNNSVIVALDKFICWDQTRVLDFSSLFIRLCLRCSFIIIIAVCIKG